MAKLVEGDAKAEGGEVFSSRLGLILATIGAAVGTGNIWRFPREAAANGGGSFMIGWLIFLFAWSIPLLMAEFAIGKKTRLGTIGAMRDMGRLKPSNTTSKWRKKLAGKNFTWMGMWMVWVGAAVGFYYAVVMGWTIRYFWVAFSGQISDATDTEATTALWNNFINAPGEVMLFQLIAVAVSGIVVYKGIKGIESANKVLIPALVGFLILAMIWPFVIDPVKASQGLRFLFIPQPAYLWKGETWISALTQSAWSTSAGFGMAITYAVAMKKKEDISLNAFLTGLGNNSVSLIAGVAVLGTVFALSANTTAGLEAVTTEEGASGLTFIHLTALFSTMPAGRLMGGIFFLAMSFAALTSMIATVEIAARNFMDMGWERKKAVRWICLAILLFGIPSAASLHYLDNQDFVWGTGLIVSGLFVAFMVIKFGTSEFRQKFINTKYSDLYIGPWWEYVIKYIFPLEFAIVFSYFIWEKLAAGKTTLLATMVVQWALVLGLFIFFFNDKIARLVKRGPMSDGDYQYDGREPGKPPPPEPESAPLEAERVEDSTEILDAIP